MGMSTAQVEQLAQFMDNVQAAAVDAGISIPDGQTLVVAVSDGEGGDTQVVLQAREKGETSECDYDWWLELRSVEQ